MKRPLVHPNIRTGKPCHCGFYQPHSALRHKQASKLDWLKDRPDFQTPENQRLWKLLQHHTVNVGTKLDPLLPWIAREVKKGRIHHSEDGTRGHLYVKEPLDAPPEEYTRLNLGNGDLAHLADWYGSNHPSRQGVDLMQHTWPEIKGKVGEWDKYLEEQQAKADQEKAAGGEVVHSWPDGWNIRRLGPEHLDFEGDAMGHCVGGYGYDQQVRDGETQIYSLRDPQHQPHATMELTTDDQNGWGHPQYPGKTMSGQDAEDLFHETGEGAIPMPHNGRLVQIQGKSDSMPIPEYQARFKDWLGTFPEEERPYWEAEDEATEPRQLIDHPENQGGLGEDGYGGGYGPHGDYGVRVEQPVDYERMLENILERENDQHRGGYPARINHDDLDAMYKAAVRRQEVPEFAKAMGPFSEEQQENFDEWRMMNSEYAMNYPDGSEEYPITPEDPNYPLPDTHFEHGEPIENADQHERMYYEDENSWAEQHPGMEMTNYLYRLLNPHYGPFETPQQVNPRDPDSRVRTDGYQNQLFQDPTAAYQSQVAKDPYASWLDKRWEHPGQDQWNQQQQPRLGHIRKAKPHPHFRTGDPCYCPWGSHHNQEVLGAVHEASKIDWLIDRQDKFSKTPEGQEALKYLKGLVNQSDKMDPLTPWLYREIKKKRLKVGPEGLEIPNSPVTGLPLEHWADWFGSNSPTRRGVDIMQMSAPEMENKVAEWDEELRSKMDEARQMEGSGEVIHRFPDDWSIRRLKPNELGDEGDAMGHCVGDTRMGYDRQVEMGNAGIFSLRNPKGEPHTTVEMRPAGETRDTESHDENGMLNPEGAAIWQIQGKSDEEPIEEYKERLRDWFKTLHPPAHVPSNQEKTTVPLPTDPNELAFWNEPEHDPGYGGNDPYRLSPEEGADYGLDESDDDPFEYEGEPDWDKIVHNTLNKVYSGRGYIYEPDAAENVASIAQERDYQDELAAAAEKHYPGWETKFYQNVYNPEAAITPQEQWNNWDRGQVLNGLMNGSRNLSALRRGPDEESLPLAYQTPDIHPEQGSLPLPTETPGPGSGDEGRMIDFGPSSGPYRPMTVDRGRPSWYAPMSKVAAKAPPIYYRWVFSPKGGVSLSDNDTTHPAWTPYHRDIAGTSGEARLIHGYAYRIGDGWRLTTDEHKPVHDNFVVAQVVRALMEREGHQTARHSVWTPTEWDFERSHYGLPASR